MKNAKRLWLRALTLLLALCTMLGAFAACKGDSGKTPLNSEKESSTQAPTGESYYPLSGDYEGRTFSLLARADYSYEFDVNELTADEVQNAVYSRNASVEKNYNIFIDVTTLYDSYQNNEMRDRLNNLYGSGTADEDYDLIGGTQYRAAGLIINGWFQDWNKMNYIDLDADIWTNGVTSGMEMNNQRYGITGDLSLAFWKCIGTMLFNKTWVTQVWDENLYTVVSEGEWTYEYFKEVVIAASVNDGISPDDGDGKGVYGFGSDPDVAIDGFVAAFGLNLVKYDENGKLSTRDMGSEEIINFVEEMQNFYTASNGMAWAYMGVDPSYPFRKDQIMIAPMRFEMIERMKDWTGDYGIIPYPKYNSQQQSYASPLVDGSTLFMIPKTNRDTDFTCIITSALAESSATIVIPQYYERVIRTKSVKDPQSYEMLDLIRKTVTIDLSVLWCLTSKDLVRKTINSVILPQRPGEMNYVSNLEAQLPTAEEQIKQFNDFFFGTESN